MLKGLVIGFTCFLLFLLVHVMLFHYAKEIKERFVLLTRIFYFFTAVYIMVYFASPQLPFVLIPGAAHEMSEVAVFVSALLNFSSGLVLYIFLFLGYCQFYFIVDRSISVRIMIHIENAASQTLTYDELKAAYDPDYIFKRRLQHMVEGNYITVDQPSGSYRNTVKGKAEAIMFRFLKEWLKLGIGG